MKQIAGIMSARMLADTWHCAGEGPPFDHSRAPDELDAREPDPGK